MKNQLLFLLLLSFFFSCQKQQEKETTQPTPVVPNPSSQTSLFVSDDGTKPLNGTFAEIFQQILKKVDSKYLSTGYNPSLTEAQWKEIKDETDKLSVAGNQEKTFRNIFSWIYKSLKYDLSDNEAYAVFKNKRAVCQGYANLLKIMLRTQNIPCVIVSGNLKQGGLRGNDTPLGHAWNYVQINGKWLVSDPTNNGIFEIENVQSYKHLEPLYVDIIVNEDENYVYTYREGFLSLQEVKKAKGERLSVPFSTMGFQINAFNPLKAIPQPIKEIYIGKNILSLGENIIGLKDFGTHIEKISIDPQNPNLEEYKNIVYKKGQETPHFIPQKSKIIELKPIEKVEKGIILNHNSVTEIIFPKNTKHIGAYAVEKCPKLNVVRASTSTEIDKNAFWECGDNLKIVRY